MLSEKKGFVGERTTVNGEHFLRQRETKETESPARAGLQLKAEG